MSPSKIFLRQFWRWPRVLAVLLIAATILIVAVVMCSPWPSALVFRWLFDRNGSETNAALAAYAPADIEVVESVRYDPDDASAVLDIYRPRILDTRPLPVVFWIHGGGYLGGSRRAVANYARILASDGYAVVAADYGLAPGIRYPVPVAQLGRALAFLSKNADALKLDADRVVLGGDSGGAQLASQLAAITASPAYAHETGLSSGISIDQLRGVVLFCGPHDGRLMASEASPSWFLKTVIWSYLGSLDPPSATVEAFSIPPHVTHAFPPAFISVGNGDPLAPQSVALANALHAQGVPVDTLFYPAAYRPSLPHEYQFNFKFQEAREALRRTRTFLREHLGPQGG